MSIAFSRSTLSLAADGQRRSVVGLLVAAGLLAAWMAWFFLARVSVFELAESARVEVHQRTHPVQATYGGRVQAVRARLGQQVVAGQVLIELDSAALQLELTQKRARHSGIAAQLGPLRAQISAHQRALAEQRPVAEARLREARASSAAAAAAASFADAEVERSAQLRALQVESEADQQRAVSEARLRDSNAHGQRAAVERVLSEERVRRREREIELARLSGEVARLEGQMAEEAAAIEVLRLQVEERLIKAPIAGRVGEMARVQVGSVVSQGERVASVVPPGALRVVAEFSPARAAGRIRAGQRAQVRLDGFPATQFGSIGAQVTNVASEVREGHVQVELSLQPSASPRVHLQHGLPGTVEVEVERSSPAALTLRAAGRLIRANGG
jgi:multidrug resistance efflux pump